MKLFLNHENLSLDNLRHCDEIALGTACKLLREFGHTNRELWTKHPELWCPIVPAEPFRQFLISGGV